MFNSIESRECLKGLIGWRNHYDLNEIPTLNAGLLGSESGEHYQDKHPAMRLDLIQSTIPNNRNLSNYLTESIDSSITELLNDIYVSKELKKNTKELVNNKVIYNNGGFITNTIISSSRFVGIMFKPDLSIGLKATINRIALQMTQSQAGFDLYLYHSHKAKYLKKINYTTTQGNQFNWIDTQLDLKADDKDISGGVYYLGYYQDDIQGQAIAYKKLDWNVGYCGSCDGGANQTKYSSITKYVKMKSFYVPNANLNADHDFKFDEIGIIESNKNNWGFNFNISVKCDLTNFWCDNRMTLKNALGLKVVLKILKDITFSQQLNNVEEQLKMMIIRDLEGDKETNHTNIQQQYERALKSLNFNHSSINEVCLPCSVKSGVTYGTI